MRLDIKYLHTPYVAVEEVPCVASRQRQLRLLPVRDEPNRGDHGDAADGDDGADEEDQEREGHEDDHPMYDIFDPVQLAEAEDCSSVIEPGALLDAEEDGRPVRGEEEEEQHKARGDSKAIVLHPLVGPNDGEDNGVEAAGDRRHHEAAKGVLLRDQQHEARQHELARQLERLPPEVGQLVLLVEEGGRPCQSIRRLGLQRLVAGKKEGRVEDQRAGGPDETTKPMARPVMDS